MHYKLIDTEYNWNESIQLEQEIYSACLQMANNGFHLDVEEVNKQIDQLEERITWAESVLIPMIPAKPKRAYTAEVKKVFKINGQYTKSVLDWYNDTSSLEIVGPFTRVEYQEINLNSSKQVREWLEKNGWKPDTWNYQKDKKGKDIRLPDGSKIKTTPKITDTSLEDSDLGQAGKVYLYYRKCTHKRNTLRGLLRDIRDDGTVPSLVNTFGAATGRMTHRIIVNIPGNKAPEKKGDFVWRTMRKCFSAPAGYKIVGCDADQCQIRGLAHYMQDAAFLEALLKGRKENGTDIHSVNAKLAGLNDRQHAKALFYGYLFGAGVAKTASQLGISKDEADKIRKRFERNLKGLKRLLDELKDFWKNNGYIVGLDGRKIYVTGEHMLLVYLLQCFEAVLMKRALMLALEEFNKRGLEAYLVTFQHDEFQFRVKEEHAEQVAKILRESIEKAGTYYNLNCPISGEAKIGNNWLETH